MIQDTLVCHCPIQGSPGFRLITEVWCLVFFFRPITCACIQANRSGEHKLQTLVYMSVPILTVEYYPAGWGLCFAKEGGETGIKNKQNRYSNLKSLF